MEFICTQNWDEMKPTVKGRYCSICKKEVFDFRNDSNLNTELIKKNELCGIFNADQVEEGITPIELNFFTRTKKILATALTFSGIETAVLKAQDREVLPHLPETIQVDSATTKKAVCIIPADTVEKEEPAVHTRNRRNLKQFMHVGRIGFYWSKRFPFIKIRRRHLMGRFKF